MKKFWFILFLSLFSLFSLVAQSSTSIEQEGHPLAVSDTISAGSQSSDCSSPDGDFMNTSRSESNNWLAFAGIIIALVFGIAQWASSYNMYRATKLNNKTSKYLDYLEDFSREIYILKEERLCLIEALKTEGQEGQMVDQALLVNESILRNLRDAALDQLHIPRKTIKQSTIEEYMNLPSVPRIKAVPFKYKKQ